MEKKEFPKSEIKKKSAPELDVKSKLSGVSVFFFGITKFILGILLLPFVYSATRAFLNELNTVDASIISYFWIGAITFIIIHLLIWELAGIYTRGHKILEVVFSFFKPLVNVAPFLLPIYTIVLFCLYLLLSLVIKPADILNYFLFLFGFSLCLHLVFSAKTLRFRKGDFLKGNYIFGFSFVYLLNLGIICLIFNLIFDKFSFVNFSNQSWVSAQEIFRVLFTQLFVVSK